MRGKIREDKKKRARIIYQFLQRPNNRRVKWINQFVMLSVTYVIAFTT